MADHERDAGALRGGDDGAAFLHRGGDRLLHQDVNAMANAGQRQIAVQMGGRRNGDGIDAARDQSLHVGVTGAAERFRNQVALLAIRIGDPDQLDFSQIGKDARMVGAHDADPDHAQTQRTARTSFRGVPHDRIEFPLPLARRAP